MPYRSTAYNQEAFYNYCVYRDDEKSILTPIAFAPQINSEYLEYDNVFRGRGFKTYTNLIEKFTGWNTVLSIFMVKDKKYLCGAGSMFRYEISEDSSKKLFPIAFLCFDEDSLLEDNNLRKLTFVVNIREFDNETNKSMRSKLLKLMEKCVKEQEFSIIYTNDIEKWCFSPNPKLKFKSIKEQNEFLEEIVKETV